LIQVSLRTLYKYIHKLNTFLEGLSEKTNRLYEKLSSLKKENDRALYNSIRERSRF